MSVTREDVLDALKRIVNPATGTDLIASDIVRALTVDSGKVRFVMEVDPSHGKAMEPVREAAQKAVEALAGEGNVSAMLTAHSAPKPSPSATRRKSPTASPRPSR